MTFQSTLLIRGATFAHSQRHPPQYISIHAPHTRSDPLSYCRQTYRADDFNPRSSYEERLRRRLKRSGLFQISIHAPHTRSDVFSGRAGGGATISIHAPHTRSDLKAMAAAAACRISIHAPHTRSDMPSMSPRSIAEFQSTLLIRGATIDALEEPSKVVISIHAPHTRSDATTVQNNKSATISIHAPHTRSDVI